jgi:hypothetical protein
MATKEELLESVENLIDKLYEILESDDDSDYLCDQINDQLDSFSGYLENV